MHHLRPDSGHPGSPSCSPSCGSPVPSVYYGDGCWSFSLHFWRHEESFLANPFGYANHNLAGNQIHVLNANQVQKLLSHESSVSPQYEAQNRVPPNLFDPADVLSDALLIIIPCQLVYKIRLSRSQKIRVLSIFSASAITTVVCLVHSYYLFTQAGITESVTATVEVWFRFQPRLSNMM